MVTKSHDLISGSCASSILGPKYTPKFLTLLQHLATMLNLHYVTIVTKSQDLNNQSERSLDLTSQSKYKLHGLVAKSHVSSTLKHIWAFHIFDTIF